jgi:flagellar FliJ protein
MVNQATTPRHTRFDIAEKTRKVELLETMIRDFRSTAADLARAIGAEEERTRIKDPNHAAYSMLAKALAMRRGKLLMSAADAEMRLLAARHEVEEAPAIASREVEKATAAGSMMEFGRVNDQASHAA